MSGYLFGFKKTNEDRYVRPVISGNPAQCAQVVQFRITLDNRSCNEGSGMVALVLDELVDYVPLGVPPSAISGDTLWWNFDSIAPYGYEQINLYLQMPDASHTGDTLHFKAFTWLDEPDGSFTFSESYSYWTVVLCSYDPNDKLVDRTSVPYDYDPLENELVYTIRFQNTGNDTATIVRLRDTLGAGLNWASLRPLGSSHPYEVSLNEQTGLLQFTFNNIHLPDSTTNARESQGFVQFAIQLQPGLLPGTIVSNRAGIYFDANPAVLTNTVQTLVSMPLAFHSPTGAQAILVAPNPTGGVCTLRFLQLAGKAGTLQLFNAQGQFLQNFAIPEGSSEFTLDLDKWPAGLYWLYWAQPGQGRMVSKLLKL